LLKNQSHSFIYSELTWGLDESGEWEHKRRVHLSKRLSSSWLWLQDTRKSLSYSMLLKLTVLLVRPSSFVDYENVRLRRDSSVRLPSYWWGSSLTSEVVSDR
jgi:hypothetical protein